MRKITYAAALAATGLGVFAAPGMASTRDSAVGGSNNTSGFFQIGLSAHSDSTGANPKGHVSARSRPQGGFPVPFKFGGEVTCLRVIGNKAAIKYRFDRSDNPMLAGGGIEVFLEDNGEPSRTRDGAAFGAPMNQVLFELSNPALCSDPRLAPYQPVDSGNFNVDDR